MRVKFLTLSLTLSILIRINISYGYEEPPWNLIIGADPSKLTSQQKLIAIKLINKKYSYYGCTERIIRCFKKEPPSKFARRIAGLIVRYILKGYTEKEVEEVLEKRALSINPPQLAQIDLREELPSLGSKNALVTVVEYIDFECPFCKIISPLLEKITLELQSKVRLIVKYFPVRGHKGAIPAGLAAWAALRQGKFWEFHSLLYKNFKKNSEENLLSYAKELNLNLEKFKKDMSDPKIKDNFAKSKLEGLKNGVEGTPTIFVNNKKYYGDKDYFELKDRIEEEIDIVEGLK